MGLFDFDNPFVSTLVGGPIGLGIYGAKQAFKSIDPANSGYQSPFSQEYYNGIESVARSIQERPDTASFADALLKQNQQAQMNQAMALASSGRGNVNPALLQRQVMQRQGQAAQGAAQQAGVIRAQEALANRQLNDQMALQYRSMGQNAALGQSNIAANLAGQGMQAKQQLIGSMINAGGGAAAALLAHGGKVPGKAEVSGDSTENDKVPAMLSPGEIVVPRTKAKDPELAKEFIDQLAGQKKGKVDSFAKVLESQRAVEERLKKIEKLLAKKD